MQSRSASQSSTAGPKAPGGGAAGRAIEGSGSPTLNTRSRGTEARRSNCAALISPFPRRDGSRTGPVRGTSKVRGEVPESSDRPPYAAAASCPSCAAGCPPIGARSALRQGFAVGQPNSTWPPGSIKRSNCEGPPNCEFDKGVGCGHRSVAVPSSLAAAGKHSRR